MTDESKSSQRSADPTKPPPGGARRVLLMMASVFVTLLILVVLLTLVEFILRWARPTPGPGALVLNAELGWDRTPPVEKPIPATVPDPNPLRILFMGDSFTHNTAWSRLVIEELNRRGIAATGWEAGVSGYGQVQEALKLQKILPEMKPDLVVLLFYAWNDPRDNCPSPGIIYNADMVGRPYLREDGTIERPSEFWMDVRGTQLFHRLLEGWWYGRIMTRSRHAMDPAGPSAVTGADGREMTIYTDPKTWLPFYQPSQQSSAYVTRAWKDTARAFALAIETCRKSPCGLVIAGIDSPLTIDRDVFDEQVAKDPGYRADDFDSALPLRRFAEIITAAGITPVLPAQALSAYAANVKSKIYDGKPGDISGHLLPLAQGEMAKVVADGVEAWIKAGKHPPSAPPPP